MAPPMPPVAPVTSAVLPVRSNIYDSLVEARLSHSCERHLVNGGCPRQSCAHVRVRAATHEKYSIAKRAAYERAVLKAATSFGVPIATPLAPSAMRLTRPLSTLPAPTS